MFFILKKILILPGNYEKHPKQALVEVSSGECVFLSKRFVVQNKVIKELPIN